jgi:hypothetical protein
MFLQLVHLKELAEAGKELHAPFLLIHDLRESLNA